MKYVLLLRGINVGAKLVKMQTLKKMLEDIGFMDVKTLLNSGNVVFDLTDKMSAADLRQRIEEKLAATFGFQIHTILQSMEDIKKLVASDPFKGIKADKDTRLYITFLSGEKPAGVLKIPYESPEKDVRILYASDRIVASVITLSTNNNTTDLMKIMEKEFSKDITTRNWNTVLKISLLANQ